MFKHPILIETATITQDEIGNQTAWWSPYHSCRANINGVGGKEYYNAAAQTAQNDITFEVRYCKALKDLKPQTCRVVYQNKIYNIVHIDDFQQNHQTLKIRGVVNE